MDGSNMNSKQTGVQSRDRLPREQSFLPAPLRSRADPLIPCVTPQKNQFKERIVLAFTIVPRSFSCVTAVCRHQQHAYLQMQHPKEKIASSRLSVVCLGFHKTFSIHTHMIASKTIPSDSESHVRRLSHFTGTPERLHGTTPNGKLVAGCDNQSPICDSLVQKFCHERVAILAIRVRPTCQPCVRSL